MKHLFYSFAILLTSFSSFSQNVPVVTYVQPFDNFTATPSMHFKIKVANDTNYCTVTLRVDSTILVSTVQFKDSADWDVDLGAYDVAGGMQSILITVSDTTGQLSSRLIHFYTEIPSSFSGLSTFYNGANQILDFNNNKIFALGDYNLQPGIIDLNTNIQTPIPFTQPVYYSQQTVSLPQNAYITNYGAFFYNALVLHGYITTTNATSKGVYDWNSGVLDYVADSFVLSTVKDSFAAWSSYGVPGIYIRNFNTQQNTLVTDSADNFYDIGGNGLLVYSSTSKQNMFNLFTYKNGVTTQLTTDGTDATENGIKNLYPKTDGQYTAYAKVRSCCGTTDYQLYVNDGLQNTFVSDLGPSLIQPNYLVTRSFAVNNKYVAFCAPDNTGKAQVWLRDSAANIKQLTSFNDSVGGIETLAPNGDIMFFFNSHRYLAQKSGAVYMVSDSIGKSYYNDSAWYVVLGNVIFKFTPNTILPLNLVSFTGINQGKVNVLNWQTTNEVNTASFDVEKSQDAINFTAIGSVAADGSSTSTATYSYTDVAPADGINYYRLKMLDNNGLFTYSKIISINNASIAFTAAVLPNPVQNTATLKITSNINQQLNIQLVDVNGRLIQTAQIAVTNGTTLQPLNVDGLAKGMYLLRVVNSANKPLTTLKLMKS